MMHILMLNGATKVFFIKYLLKYVTKRSDCSKIYLQRIRDGENTLYDEETDTINEVKEYLDSRYIRDKDSLLAYLWI
jgi:hypothetical protein